MLIKGISVNPADMMPVARQDIPENVNQAQPEENIFGPEYEVTISEEGKALSELQTAQPGAGGQAVQNSKMMEVISRQLEETQLDAKTRKGYWDELDGIEELIKVYNAAYGRVEEKAFKEAYDKASMEKIIDQEKAVVEQQRLLQEAAQEQADFQSENGLRLLREALKMADMKSAKCQGEIDENNRDLTALLKTMEEAEKAEEERENGISGDDKAGASDKENSAGGAVRDSAAGFLKASINHEKSVKELAEITGDEGRGFLMQADSAAKGLLKKSASIKAAIEDNAVPTEQIREMMKSFRSEVEEKNEEMYILGSFGMQVLRDTRNAKIQRTAEDPSKSMMQTKNGMMQAASDAAIGEAWKGRLDKGSKELAEEVERLIDERNHVERTHQEKPEEEAQEKVLQAEEQKEA